MASHRPSDVQSMIPHTNVQPLVNQPNAQTQKRGLKDRDEVWAAYLIESSRRDTEMLEACNKNMDVLLIFAGLFSAVLTAFTVNSYMLLRPDSQAQTDALLERIANQLSSPAGMSANVSVNITTPFTPMPSAVRFNILWFSSLTCSLLAALGAVLAKQWMVEYPSGAAPSATPCERARHRQVRFAGITTWHFLDVIQFLPTMLQIAFALFFIGLCEFLFSLDARVGRAVAVLCVLGLLLVVFTHLAGMIDPSCPFRTPLSTSLAKLAASATNRCMALILGPAAQRPSLWASPAGWRGRVIKGWKLARHGHTARAGTVPRWARPTATLAEDARLAVVNAEALAWLLSFIPDEDVVVTISALMPELPASDISTPLADALPRLCALFQSYFTFAGAPDRLFASIIPREGQEEKIKIVGRAIHRIMLRCQPPPNSPAARATCAIGDVFGDSFLVFPPRDVSVDVHSVVCCLFATDTSYSRRYSLSVREQLFLSLLGADASPWATSMVLDSLCGYVAAHCLTNGFRNSLVLRLTQLLQQRPVHVELSSALALTIRIVVSQSLDIQELVSDKAESLPQNLLKAISVLMAQLQVPSSDHNEEDLQNVISALLLVNREFALAKEFEFSFTEHRTETLTLLCNLLSCTRLISSPCISAAISLFDCYPNDMLSCPFMQVDQALSKVIDYLRMTMPPDSGSDNADNAGAPGCDLGPTIRLIDRLINVLGETDALASLHRSPDAFARSLVRALQPWQGQRCKWPQQWGLNEEQHAVLQLLARRASFWFERSGLLPFFESAGLGEGLLQLLEANRHWPPEESPSKEALSLAVVMVDHLVPVSPALAQYAQPLFDLLQWWAGECNFELYFRQQCTTAALRVLVYTSGDVRGRLLQPHGFLSLVGSLLAHDADIEGYMLEDWCRMARVIAETHLAELINSGFLDGLVQAANSCGCQAATEWITQIDHR